MRLCVSASLRCTPKPPAPKPPTPKPQAVAVGVDWVCPALSMPPRGLILILILSMPPRGQRERGRARACPCRQGGRGCAHVRAPDLDTVQNTVAVLKCLGHTGDVNKWR